MLLAAARSLDITYGTGPFLAWAVQRALIRFMIC